MFHIMILEGNILDKNLVLTEESNYHRHMLIEYKNELNKTFLYLFHIRKSFIDRLFMLLKPYRPTLSHNNYHYATNKLFYYDPKIGINTLNEGTLLFTQFMNLNLITKQFSKNYFIFFEMNQRRNKIRVMIEFDDIAELIEILKDTYEVKYVIPFFYSNREMKEFHREKRIKVKELNILYILEYKTLEGRKR